MDFTLKSMLPISGAIEATPMGWVLYDADLVVRDMNDSASCMLGVPRENLLGHKLLDLAWVANSEEGVRLTDEQRPVIRSLRTAQTVVDTVIALRIEGGTSRWFSVSAYPVVIDGEVRAVATAYLDVTKSIVTRNHLNILFEVSRLIHLADSQGAYLGQLCETLVSVGGYALAVVTSGIGDQTKVVSSAGLGDEFQRVLAQADPRMLHGGGFTGVAMRTRSTRVVNDLLTDPTMEHWRGHLMRLQIRSAIAIPFVLGEEILSLSVYSNFDHHFDDVVVAAIEEMAREISMGLTHIATAEQLRRAFGGTLAALAGTSEVRDPYTAGHQRNVGRLGAALATKLGLDAALVTLVDQAGTVHDIGKISIPAEILTRPGRLSDIEFEMMRAHTAVGYDILTTAQLPWPIPEVARQHHERLDGSGYPQGLRGDDIVLPARIIAVADVVEAMAHHRPYRAAQGLDKALDEIARGAGSLYDSSVVEACLDVFEHDVKFFVQATRDTPELASRAF